jgi:Zn-finger nucleic acid-binding protein
MRCPACKETRLTLAERQGVEIDYCPDCRGVWLDRGELDKIIDRVAEGSGERPRSTGRRERDAYPGVEERDDDERPGKRGRRRESLLGDLFDFGG